MDPAFWQTRWQQGQIGFHQNEVNPYLRRHWQALQPVVGESVFVPLCGKSLDMVWLRDQGHAVIGVEVVGQALAAFFAEQRQIPERYDSGSFQVYKHGGIKLLQGDFFDLVPMYLDGARLAFDRAALIALPADQRPRYTRHLSALLPAQAAVLLVTLDYPSVEMEGPPFAVTDDEVEALYGRDFRVERLERVDVLDHHPRFRERGLTRLQETVYRLTRG